MIATYIQDLLATNNRVIVPNYGAFLVRATSKSKDANTLEEKLNDIYFSPFLKFNDELLEKHIIKKENITKEQATQKITQFIEDIKKELEQEKPYIIEGFGRFEADKQGKVQFSIVTKEPSHPASDKEKKPESTTKKSESKAEIKPKTQETKKGKIKEKLKASEAQPAQPTGGKESKPAEQAGKTGFTSKLEEFKPEKKEPARLSSEQAGGEPKTTPATAQTKSVYSYKKEKKPINKGLVWSIAIGLPVAAIFIWALLNFETIKKVLNKEKIKTEKAVQKKKPTTAKKTAVKPKSEQAKPATPAGGKETTAKAETKKPEIKKPATPQKKYYIIAGSFKNKKYAISYLNKLQADGYNAEILAERNGMHAVSFNSFTDKRKAIAEYKFLAQEKGLQAWILYY